MENRRLNRAIAVHAEALSGGKSVNESLRGRRKTMAEPRDAAEAGATDSATRVASGEPLAGMLSGKSALVWAHAQVVCDSPDKKSVEMAAPRPEPSRPTRS